MGAAIIPMSFDDENTSVEGLNVACQSIPFLFCIGFTLVFAALFSKMWRVNKLFNNPKMRRVKVTVLDVCKPLFALLFANILVLAIWTALSPLVWVREDISLVESVGECTSEGAAVVEDGGVVPTLDDFVSGRSRGVFGQFLIGFLKAASVLVQVFGFFMVGWLPFKSFIHILWI